MATRTVHGPTVELTARQVRRVCDPATLNFETTASLNMGSTLLGQDRAVSALTFGLAMRGGGFNVYASGPPGTGKATAVRAFLERAAREKPTPDDWCYVHNFYDPARPRAVRLPHGQGRRLRDAVARVIQTIRREIPRVFEGDDYIAHREALLGALTGRREEGLEHLSRRARALGFVLKVGPMGFVLLPAKGDHPISDDDLATLTPEAKRALSAHHEQLMSEARAFMKDMRAAERETRDQLEAQDRDVALTVVGGLLEDLLEEYEEQPAVTAYLQELREGVLSDIALFQGHPLPADGAPRAAELEGNPSHAAHERAFRKYEVNVVVDNGDTTGAPVICDANPTHPNLVGRIEREALFGALLTDFTLIRAGALHRANGGYLVLRVEDVFSVPMAWQGLMRSLREGAIVIEDLGEALGYPGTRSLRPDPIPLDLKIVLLGQPMQYAILHEVDHDFQELFKVRADFETVMARTPATELAFAGWVAALQAEQGRPFDRGAVARLIDESSRLADDQRKLSVRFGPLADIVREADHWAAVDGCVVVGAAQVRAAIEQRRFRSALAQDRQREAIARGILMIRPTGREIGQVHGLAVVQVGDVPFGHPCRITATVGAGREGVVDIERQAELGGPIHSKGVLILGGYLADQYAQDKPLALAARLVFEQSYDQVEGDSASLSELLALLSRLGDVPLRQGVAVTGSVNQRGQVQPVGGVNEKIEGFYDACQAAGAEPDQGVILPTTNVEHLMLREDIADAMAAGQFHVYAVRTVDEALEVMTGRAAGPRTAHGTFARGGIHRRVDDRLRALADALQAFATPPDARAAGLALANGTAHNGPVGSLHARAGSRRRRTRGRPAMERTIADRQQGRTGHDQDSTDPA